MTSNRPAPPTGPRDAAHPLEWLAHLTGLPLRTGSPKEHTAMLRTCLLVVATIIASSVLLPRSAHAGGVACQGYENILFCGELNGDCEVTSTDALLALRMGVGQLEAVGVADLNHSGGVTAGDALEVLRIAV